MRNVCFIFLMLILVGCSSTDIGEYNPKEIDSYINVSIQTSQTKASTDSVTIKENAIKHLAFYIFKKSGSLEKKYEFQDENGGNISLSTSFNLKCLSGEKYLYVVANAPSLYAKLSLGTNHSQFDTISTEKQLFAPASPFVMTGKGKDPQTGSDILNVKPNPD
ncbi:MAG: fimbrial protein, partial [Bacteroidales bacterium]